MLMGGYTFAQMHSQRHWYCSQKRKGCKARVKLDTDGTLISALTEHNHLPPNIHVTKTGHYLILRNAERCYPSIF